MQIESDSAQYMVHSMSPASTLFYRSYCFLFSSGKSETIYEHDVAEGIIFFYRSGCFTKGLLTIVEFLEVQDVLSPFSKRMTNMYVR